jgi:serine/threonine protein phosphatase PrpC
MVEPYFGITDTGRMRTNNEDAFIAGKVLQGRYIAACVIDGVGGYAGGEVAAAIAKQAILDYFTVPSGDVLTMMKEAFAVANQKIGAEKEKNREYESMACVVTMALADVAAKTFYYAHIGDTRLYLMRDNSLVKISKDHSFVGYLEDSGRLSEEEAMQHPKRNEINKALGFDPQFNVADIETGSSPFLPGDVLLLCSDGLTDMLKSSEITAVLADDKPLETKAKELVQRANDRGGKDNITVVLVRNTAKSVKQKATKPTAPAAVAAVPEKKSEVRAEATNTPPPARKQRNTGTLFLAILSILLAAALAVVLLRKGDSKVGILPTGVVQKNPQETEFQQAVDSAKAGTLVMPDSIAALPVVLTDTIRIQADSLHIHGNSMRFLKSSAYEGPAFALASTCRYLLLENLTLENFDVGVLVRNRSLHLKNVRFIYCRVPVQYQFFFSDNTPVSGAVAHFFTTDSLSR